MAIPCNVARVEQVLRVTLGLVIIGLGAYWGSWWALVGLLPLVTGIWRFCPLYSLLGISTCRHPD